MLLVTAATNFEMDAFLDACPSLRGWNTLLTGVGPVEAAMQVTAGLVQSWQSISGVINFGVAGAYVRESSGAALLDLCIAEREVLGDLGICHGDHIIPLRGSSFDVFDAFDLHSSFLDRAISVLERAAVPFHRGPFVTVNCVSGSSQRGDQFSRQHQAVCENMEGAAVARVCAHFRLPLVELRCISNLVENRNPQHWRLEDACRRCGHAVAQVVQGLTHG
ncbi:futalosine hydrolase [Desulfobulbus propionicus]|jgi:futalosine hydrolase